MIIRSYNCDKIIKTLQAASKTANIIINKVNFHISRLKEAEEGF